jgi:hypothetical protein
VAAGADRADGHLDGADRDAVLANAGFEYLGKFDFMREERWTAATLTGFMYSTSILNRDSLGDLTEELERDLTSLVDSYGSRGVVVAKAGYAYQMARKPS